MELIKKGHKKAQGHIEVILSFVIFIGFVIMMLIFLNPVREQGVSYAAVDKAQAAMIKNISIDYKYVSLVLNNSFTGCFYVDNSFGSKNIAVTDASGNYLPSNNSGGKIYIGGNGNSFYGIYFSDSFNAGTLSSAGCIEILSGNYSYGSLFDNNRVLYENLKILNDAYVADYPKLKSGLGIDREFEFIVYELNRNVLLNDSLRVHNVRAGNIISREIPLRTINMTAGQKDIILNIRVW